MGGAVPDTIPMSVGEAVGLLDSDEKGDHNASNVASRGHMSTPGLCQTDDVQYLILGLGELSLQKGGSGREGGPWVR